MPLPDLRNYKVYLIIIATFNAFYLISMVIPIDLLYFWRDLSKLETYFNDRTAIQEFVFSLLLPVVLLIHVRSEFKVSPHSKFVLLWFKSVLTIIIILGTTNGLFHLFFDHTTLNIHYHLRGAPTRLIGIYAISINSIGMLILKQVLTSKK